MESYVTALTDAIYQNTGGNSEGYPLGLSWDTGIYGTHTLTPAPAGFSAVTGWGVVYPQAGAPLSPSPGDDTVQVANFTTYVHLTDGTWVKVQDQAQSGVGGAHYVADFAGDANIPWQSQNLSDGSVSFNAPPTGYNDHFWQGSRGTFTPGTVDGVFVVANMKTNDPSANLVAQIGADWWRDASAPYLYQNGQFVNNPVVGGSNFVKLTTEWRPVYYSSLSASQLQASPPPPLQGASAPTTPTQPTTPTTPPNLAPSVTQASASPGTGVADNGDTITLTLGFSEAVTVTGTPTLSLNDGATATYVGGSGTSALTFKTTVAPTDKDTPALAITGVNLANGASIKDTSGLAANLSGAVKTFAGLQIDATPSAPTTPTTPTTPTAPTTPTIPAAPSSVTRPVLTIGDNTLSVPGRRGSVDLGTKVATTDPNDSVTVRITGLPRYERITTADGRTFRGDNITLTAAQVNSGLELSSYYRGGAPEATLTLTASARDPVTGAVTSAAPQTITVTDPRRAVTTTSTTQETNTVTNSPSSASTSTAAPTAPQPTVATDTTAASAGFLANQGFAMLRGHMDAATSTLATTRPQALVTDPQPATGATTASLASQNFALLNQYLAGNVGRFDQGQIVSAVSQPTAFGREGILARPQH
jgi:hypothetical protein